MKVKDVIKRLEAEGWKFERQRSSHRTYKKAGMEIMTALDAPEKTFAVNIGTGGKDPFTRLLDLTLGWAEYVEKDEAEHPDGVRSTDIHDAYQSVATFAEPYWDAAPEVQEMAARHFVDTRLLPLLLGNAKP